MARRRDRDEPPDILSAEEIKQLRQRMAHMSPDGVRQFYERALEECRLIYTRVPSPRKMQALMQIWKQMWKWRQVRAYFDSPLGRELLTRAIAAAMLFGPWHRIVRRSFLMSDW
jgi:hypothetical protein